jgi:hypothetical protein
VKPRERRAKEIANLAAALLGGNAEGIVNRTLDYLDDLDGAVDYFVRWKYGELLGLERGQRTDRWGITVRLHDRIEQAPALREEVLRHPRYVVALAVQEATGVRIIDFLSQVKSITIVEEEPGLHWLILPECHHGCEVVKNPEPHEERDSCQVCGNPQGSCSRRKAVATGDRDRIHAVDDAVIRLADADPATRERLMTAPLEVFTQVAFTLYGVRPREAFGIHEVKVGRDSETSLYFPLLARHESRKQAAFIPTTERRVPLAVD